MEIIIHRYASFLTLRREIRYLRREGVDVELSDRRDVHVFLIDAEGKPVIYKSPTFSQELAIKWARKQFEGCRVIKTRRKGEHGYVEPIGHTPAWTLSDRDRVIVEEAIEQARAVIDAINEAKYYADQAMEKLRELKGVSAERWNRTLNELHKKLEELETEILDDYPNVFEEEEPAHTHFSCVSLYP